MTEPTKPQLDKFKEAARDLECDDDDERFRARVGKLVGKRPTKPLKDAGA